MKRVFRRSKLPKLHKSSRFRRARLPKHPVMVPLATLVVLLLLTFGAWQLVFSKQFQESEKDTTWNVIISHDHTQEVVPSREPTVGALLKKAGVQINKGDVVEPSQDTRINQDDFRINIYRAVPVKVVEGKRVIFAYSAATTARGIAVQAGLDPYAEDLLTTEPVTNFVKQKALGEVVTIKPSVPIRLIVYGTPIVTRSHSDTVAELLKERHIKLRPGDRVQPAANTPVTPNMQVFVLHKGTKIVTKTKQIPMPVKYINDKRLSVGTQAIRQRGAPGILLITYQVNKKTGQNIKLQQVLVQEPVKQIVARGTAPVSSSLSEWLYKLRMCESHGNYQTNTGNGYYGAYQFSLSTWHRIGYSGRPDQASPGMQDQAIVKNTNLSGGGLASQNPGCYYKTGISAFPPGS